jgi:hypothetical protein
VVGGCEECAEVGHASKASGKRHRLQGHE